MKAYYFQLITRTKNKNYLLHSENFLKKNNCITSKEVVTILVPLIAENDASFLTINTNLLFNISHRQCNRELYYYYFKNNSHKYKEIIKVLVIKMSFLSSVY